MKKVLLSALTALSLSAFGQSQRTVLIEEFTNASCGPCASQNPAFNALLSNNLNKVVQIKYQTVWPGTDPMNAQNQTEVANRVTVYNVTGVPNVVMDGTVFQGAPSGITQNSINARYAVPSPFSMNVTYNYNSATDTITSVITLTNSTPNAVTSSAAGQLKLMFAVLEMNIKFPTAPGSNGETEFYYIMRKMNPDANGQALPDNIAAGQTLTYTIKQKAPSYIYQKPQMCVAAFVQDAGTKVVHQAGIGLPPNTVNIGCENTSTSTGNDFCATTYNPSFTITNKGNSAITSGTYGYTINGGTGVSQPWSGNLAAGASATLTLTPVVAPIGVNIYEPFFNNINGGLVDLMESDNFMNASAASVIGTLINNPLTENFESTTTFEKFTNQSIFYPMNLPSNIVDKTVNTTLTQKLGGFGNSDKSFRFNCYNISEGRPSLIFYKANTAGLNIKSVQFDYAYNGYVDNSGTFYDTLAVYVSRDCGVTWTELWRKWATDLKTTTAANITSANFYPKANEWKMDIANLPADFYDATELVLKLEAHSGWGNNIYVDNINLNQSVGITDVVPAFSTTILPNPASDVLTIKAGVKANAATLINITDASGKLIYTYSTTTDYLNHTVDVSNFASGIYQVSINNNGAREVKSVTVTH
jgi:hypothetical protein